MTLRKLILSCALASTGCALLGKNDPVVPRYFTPQYESDGGKARVHPELRLRLGRVSAWTHLRERMVVRNSPQELTYAEGRRWTERPEVYLKSALERTLFEERGVVEALSGVAPVLEVELAAFEELQKPDRKVRLQALVTLHDDRSGRLEETITVDEPVTAGADSDVAVVEALSRALHRGVDQISDRVVAKLASLPVTVSKAER
jgi:cholesterol transport system auxiliary component